MSSGVSECVNDWMSPVERLCKAQEWSKQCRVSEWVSGAREWANGRVIGLARSPDSWLFWANADGLESFYFSFARLALAIEFSWLDFCRWKPRYMIDFAAHYKYAQKSAPVGWLFRLSVSSSWLVMTSFFPFLRATVITSLLFKRLFLRYPIKNENWRQTNFVEAAFFQWLL